MDPEYGPRFRPWRSTLSLTLEIDPEVDPEFDPEVGGGPPQCPNRLERP